MAVTSRRISLVSEAGIRPYTTTQVQANTTDIFNDSFLSNVYIETPSSSQVRVRKRPGITQDRIQTAWQVDLSTYDVTAGQIRGAFWSDAGALYRTVGTTVHKNAATVTGVTTSTNDTYFADLDTGTRYVLIYDSDKLWYETGGAATQVTDSDFTGITSKKPGVVTLDGYVFIMDANGTIYNSAVDDPTTWVATDFISAELEADTGVRLSKHLNYILAFGTRTLEVFYNAANATGSPLSRVSSAIIRIGTRHPLSVVSIGTETYFIGSLDGGEDAVYVLEG